MRHQAALRRFAFLGVVVGGLGLLLALLTRHRNGAPAALPYADTSPNQHYTADVGADPRVRPNAPRQGAHRGAPLHASDTRANQPDVGPRKLLRLNSPLPEGERVNHRRVAFVGIVMLALIAPWLLPRQTASILFVVLITGSLAVGLKTSPQFKRKIRRINIRVSRRVVNGWGYARGQATHAEPLLSLVSAWSAAGLMVLSAMYFLPERGLDTLNDGAQYALYGGLALGAALAFARAQQQLLRQVGAQPLAPARSHKEMALTGVLGLALLAEISGNLLGTGWNESVSHHAQFAILCLSLALLTWGLSGARPSVTFLLNANWKTIATVLSITLLAFILRWWQLGEALHFFVDEVNFTSAVMHFDHNFNAPLLSPFSGLTAFPWLFPYLQAGAVNLFGHNLLGLRAVSAVMGMLTIPALYLLAKALFDHRTALLAALLLAVFPPHIHFSRLGLNNIADPLFGTLALAFLARGLTTNRRLDYVIGGVSLGLTQYFYEGGRLLYPPLALAWLALGAFLWRDRLRGHGRGIALAWLAALIVAAPIYYNLRAVDAPAAARMKDVGLDSFYWQGLLDSIGDPNALAAHIERIRYSFAVYVHMSDGSLFYGGDQPFLLAYVIPAFLLGTFFAVWRLRSPGGLLLILWVALTSLGNSLLVDSTHSTRYVVVFPALALLAAVGVRYTWRLLGLYRLPRRAGYGLAGALVLLFVLGQLTYYYGPHLDKYRFDYWFSRDTGDGQDAAFRSAGFPRGTQAHLITQRTHYTLNDDVVILSFLSNGVHMDGLLSGELTAESLDALPYYQDHAFFIEPSDQATLRLLQEHFVLVGPQYSPWSVPMGRQFLLYYAHHWQRPR